MRVLLFVLTCISILMTTGVKANPQTWSEIESLLENNKIDQARVRIDSLNENESGRKSYFQGRLALREGEAKQAIKLIRQSVKQQSDNPDYHAWLGMAYGARALSAGLFGKASAAGNSRDAFLDALELDEENLVALSGLASFHAQAPGIVGGDKDKGLIFAQRLFALDSNRGSAALIQVYIAREDYQQAVETADHWIANSDVENRVQAYIGKLTVFVRQKEWVSAYTVIDEWRENFPVNPRYLYVSGRLGVISGERLEQAASDLQAYLKRSDTDADYAPHWTHLTIGHIQEKRGDTDAARSAYRTALTFEPEFEQALEALDNLGD